MRGEAVARQQGIDGITALQAVPIGMADRNAPVAALELAAEPEASPNEAPAHDTVQENLFTTGSGKTVGAQRESNQIAELSPELVQAGTNMAKIVEEKEEAKKRTEDSVRDMIEAQQEAYWADREVECGGVTMTGAEWKAAAQYLGTAQGRKKAKEALDKAGVPKNEQDEYIRRAKDIYERMARGEKPTPEDEAFIKANPTAWNEMGKVIKERGQQSAEAKNEWSAAQQVSATTAATKVGISAQDAQARLTEEAAAVATGGKESAFGQKAPESADSGLTASVAPLKPRYNAAANGAEAAPISNEAKAEMHLASNASVTQSYGMDV